jgi:hypothetical protein
MASQTLYLFQNGNVFIFLKRCAYFCYFGAKNEGPVSHEKYPKPYLFALTQELKIQTPGI